MMVRYTVLSFVIILITLVHKVIAQPYQDPATTFSSYAYTHVLNWETSQYESYQHNSMQFRLLRPAAYVNDGTEKYPIIVFFHGAGESGSDNEKQLKHGGQKHLEATNSVPAAWPGFCLYPQLQSGEVWNVAAYYGLVKSIVDELITHCNVDPNRISIHGLSAGGGGSWAFLKRYPALVASALPMSNADKLAVNSNNLPKIEHTPIWLSQGGNDKVATANPLDANYIVETLRNNGSYVRYSYYPAAGHGIWNSTYNNADFFPFMVAASKTNIHIDFEETTFCDNETLNVGAGVTPGFDNYEWAFNGDFNNPIAINTNEIVITQPGTYQVRIYREDPKWGADYYQNWTEWSDPLVVTLDRGKTPIVTISSKGKSVNLPALDGSNSVELYAPENYTNYQWYDQLSEIIGENNFSINTSTAGDYTITVKEQDPLGYFIDIQSDYDGDGIVESNNVPLEFRPFPAQCTSDKSNNITVTTENGIGVPFAPKNFFLSNYTVSSIFINWDDMSNNELGFEIYRAENSGGPYDLIVISDATTSGNPQSYLDTLVEENTTYYYQMRAVNNMGGSEYTNEKSISTIPDINPPSTPFLKVESASVSYIDLVWTKSIDDFGINLYNIYVDGNLYSSTADTTIQVLGLNEEQIYSFYVEAIDLSNNVSNPSNQVTAATIVSGILYSYYEGVWNNLPDFSTLSPIKSGILSNFSLSPAEQSDYFAFEYRAVINIPTTGLYTFYTASDDGSKLYINENQIVNNDGLHGTRERSGQVSLSAGKHDIRVTFFEKTGGANLTVKWQGPSISKQVIPATAFINEFSFPNPPNSPTELSLSSSIYNIVNLDWIDGVANETAFEVYRSDSIDGVYNLVGTTAANATSFSDNTVIGNTTYYYKLASINSNGSSLLANPGYVLYMPLDSDLIDISGNTLTNSATGPLSYSNSQFVSSGFSVDFGASTDIVTLDDGIFFIEDQFNERTVSLWFYATDVSTNQVLYDEGGASNGCAIRVNGDLIQFVTANLSSRFIIETPVSLNQWYHVVGIFKNGTMELYLNGNLMDTGYAGFTSVGQHTDKAGLGGTNGANSFDATGNSFSGFIDELMVFEKSLNSSEVISISNNHLAWSSTTTPNNPGIPLAPDQLVISTVSQTELRLDWDDNSDNETAFEVFRTTSPSGEGFIKIAETSPGTNFYNDTDLEGNSTYYYKVRAVNEVVFSVFTSTKSGTTNNNAPSFENLADRSVKFGTTLNYLLRATDPDKDVLSISALNVPAFGTFVDNGDGSATFNFTVGSSCPNSICEYLIQVSISDGTSIINESFNLFVNDNDNPAITALSDIQVEEGTSSTIDIDVNDEDNNVKIVVLGSSTAVGTGASVTDSSWVGRLDHWISDISFSGSVLNYSQGGYTTRKFRDISKDLLADVSKNITAAIAQNPDIIIVNLPSNNVSNDIPIDTTIAHLKEFKAEADANGVLFFMTTTQPRNFESEPVKRQLLEDEANAIRAEFGTLVIDIYDELTDFTNGKRIKSEYNSGDDIHLNDSGHGYIFQETKTKLINNGGLNDILLLSDNLPSFVTFFDEGDGNGRFLIEPSFEDAGFYSGIEVVVTDQRGGIASEKFDLTVSDYDIDQRVSINIGKDTAPSPWNTTGTATSLTELYDSNGNLSDWTVDIGDASLWYTIGGTSPPDLSQIIYPVEVVGTMRYHNGSNGTIPITIQNLNTALTYNITLYGSRFDNSKDQHAEFSIGGSVQSVDQNDNYDRVAFFADRAPDANGSMMVNIDVAPGANQAVLNALIIESAYDPGVPPEAPSDLVASINTAENTVQLNWADNSSYETSQLILRATNISGPYDTIHTIPKNVTAYIDDENLSGHSSYYYMVAATNANGGNLSNVANVLTLNNNPTISKINSLFVRTLQTTIVDISASDIDGDQITFQVQNLPPFASIENLGGGDARLIFYPETIDIGSYGQVLIIANDNYSGSSSMPVFVTVISDEYENNVMVNFGNTASATSPWNNTASVPGNGQNFNNLLNSEGNPTSHSLNVLTGWDDASADGSITYSNTGIVEDSVIKYGWYTSVSAQLSFSGLDDTKFYNFTFFGSTSEPDAITRYTIDDDVDISEDLSVSRNSSDAVKINGISSNGGIVNIIVENIGSSSYAYINSIQISEYDGSILPAPTNLEVVTALTNQISLVWEDNSGNETGFEIYRKTLPDGESSIIATTGSNIDSYEDKSPQLTSNTPYEYRIRAINALTTSAYSGTAFGNTIEFSVLVNISSPLVPHPEPNNWNDLNRVPEEGYTWLDFKTLTDLTTDIDLTLDVIGAGGDLNTGKITNDNSGIYPDSVFKSYYYYEANDDLGQWTISGLDPNKSYNITLYGNTRNEQLLIVDPTGNARALTEFKLNDEKKQLNTVDNLENTITYFGVRPNASNEIEFYVYAAPISGINYGIFNAMIIEGYDYFDVGLGENYYTYYSQDNEDISSFTGWNTRIDGTGSDLTSFSDNGVEFVFEDDVDVAASSNIIIDGTGSKILFKGNSSISMGSSMTSLNTLGIELYDAVEVQINSNESKTLWVGDEGLTLNNNSILNIDSTNLIVESKRGFNSAGHTGQVGVRDGSITIISTEDLNHYLNLVPLQDSVKNLTLDQSGVGSLYLNDRIHLKNNLKISSGSIETNDNLVMVSDEFNDASILKIEGGGSIIGDVEYQRYWKRPVGTYGFYYIGSPILNQTIADWIGEFHIQGLGTSSWKNLNTYDEATSSWVGVGSATDMIEPGKGINSFMFSSNFADEYIRYNNIGPVVQGDFSFDLTYTSGEADPGWNLVANPYPCAIDWELLATAPGVVMTNVGTAFYVWDQSNGAYKVWTDASIEDAFIPSGQGFFINTNGDNPVLTVTEEIKVGDKPTFLREAVKENILQIVAEDAASHYDKAYISLMDDATAGFDAQLDAKKLDGSYLNLSSLLDGEKLAINALPLGENTYVIPLSFEAKSGDYSFTFNNLSSFSEDYKIIFKDVYADDTKLLTEGLVYEFSVDEASESFGVGRFSIEINANQPMLTIAGNVRDVYANSIRNVSISANNEAYPELIVANTDELGAFELELRSENPYDIFATKESMYSMDKINLVDYLVFNWYVRGRRGINLSDWEYLAADMDLSGQIDKQDLKLFRDLFRSRFYRNPQSFDWRFVSEDYMLERNGKSYMLDDGLELLPDAFSEKSYDLVGVIPGDVYAKNRRGLRDAESEQDQLVFTLGAPVQKNGMYHVPVYGRNFVDISGFQFSFDANVVGISGADLSMTGEDIVSLSSSENLLVWASQADVQLTLSDGSLLFYLQIARNDTNEAKAEGLVSNETGYAANGLLQSVGLSIEDLSQFDGNGNTYLGAYPNPFNDQFKIRLKIQQPESAKFAFYDTNGKLIHTIDKELSIGLYDLDLAGDLGFNGTLPKGLVIMSIKLNNTIITDKLIRD